MKSRKTKKKLKLNNIILLLFSILFLVLLLIYLNKGPYVGKIKNGKAKYIDRIVNVTSNKKDKKVIIEFKNNYKYIDNCIMTNQLYDKFKKGDKLTNLSLVDYLKLKNISAKESYNINKSIQLKIVDNKAIYKEYFAKTCGFKSSKELLKYTKSVIRLARKEK